MRALPGDELPMDEEPHSQAHAIERIRNERDRQDRKFGPPNLTPPQDRWMTILTEEYLELARALNDREPAWRVQEELVQVAAVCTRWLETQAPRWGREEHE